VHELFIIESLKQMHLVLHEESRYRGE